MSSHLRTIISSLLLIAVSSTILSAGTLPIGSVVCEGEALPQLFDGNCTDSSSWRHTGIPATLDAAFAAPVRIARVRLYPGIRSVSGMPSTECGPKELQVFGLVEGEYIPLCKEVTLPRDHQLPKEFFVDVDLERIESVSAVRLELKSGHDIGMRITSKANVGVPMEQRILALREIEFLDEETVEAERALARQRFVEAAALLEVYDKALAGDGNPLMAAIKSRFGDRMESLRQMTIDGTDAELVQRHTEYLSRHVLPYCKATLETSTDDAQPGVSLTLRAISGSTGAPAEFPVDFRLLEAATGESISRFNVTLSAVDASGNRVPILANLSPITPDRSVLAWNLSEGAAAYQVHLAPPAPEDRPPLSRLVGCGEPLMVDSVNAGTRMPWNFWNIRFRDFFTNDAAPALIAGRWTDYAHIYRNFGTPGHFSFHENAHYIPRDCFDEPVGTTGHHGLAYSLAEAADFDGDGRMDVFLSRSYNTTPIFMRNTAPTEESLEFADPVEAKSLARGYRFAYGDLDGDGIADAVGIGLKGATPVLCFQRGAAMDQRGEPRFAPPETIPLALPDSTEMSRSADEYKPTASLDDLNGDGLLDLSILVPSNLYVCFNEGTREDFRFGEPQLVRWENGQPFDNHKDFYFPNFAWQDMNGDGVLDLLCRNNNQYYPTKGSLLCIVDARQELYPLTKQIELSDCYAGLGSFDLQDLDGDGRLEFLQMSGSGAITLTRYRFQDGLFSRLEPLPLPGVTSQRYGCPDPGEFHAYYPQIRVADMDGDGLPDIIINDEHNWRFGYLSFFRNLGNGAFAPEEAIHPKLYTEHITTADSPRGKALVVTSETSLDYLSVQNDGLIAPEGGAIDFTFAAAQDEIPQHGRTFFSSCFWNKESTPTPTALREMYRNTKTLLEFLRSQKGFALVQLPDDGRIHLQAGTLELDTAPILLKAGEWHEFKVIWGAGGVTLTMDGQELGHATQPLGGIADRLHIGSMAWMAVQHFREYPIRRQFTPVDFSTPACGLFEEFTIHDASGNAVLSLDFEEEGFGPMEKRSALGYRCCPGIVEDFRGQPAMIIQQDDNRRQQQPGAVARMYAIPFQRTPGKAPAFGEAVPLNLADGTPFISNTRTVVVPYDWNEDGHMDLLLSSENVENPYNYGVELFLNDGQWNFTRIKDDAEVLRLNVLLTAHHDVKLAMARLSGAPREDMVVWADPGIRVYSRAFLGEPRPVLEVEKVER